MNWLYLSLFAFIVKHQETILTENQQIMMQRTDRV